VLSRISTETAKDTGKAQREQRGRQSKKYQTLRVAIVQVTSLQVESTVYKFTL